MDRLQSMRVFSKVVEQGSFVGASKLLNMSNAVVTRYIADLEVHLGTRLLNRTTRKLSLTEIGRAYLERVNHVLQYVEDAEAVALVDSTNPSGTLRVYSMLGFGQMQLAALLPRYAKRHPDITLDITLTAETIDLVEEGLDVGIFIGYQKFDASMITRQLAVSEILVCGSPAYFQQFGVPQIPADLSEHACLNFSNIEELRNHWPLPGPQESVINIPIKSKLLSNSGELLLRCAAADMGLIARPSFALVEELQSKRLVRVLQAHSFGYLKVTMVYPSRRQVSAKVRSFVDFMSSNYPKPDTDSWLQHT
jgi:DNA-binding transcriptional LysR family regulator